MDTITICIIVTAVSVLMALVATIVSYCLRKKKGENPNFGEILKEKIINFMSIAETKFEIYKTDENQKLGENKLDDVLMKVQNYCLTNGIQYNEEEVKNYIEKLIEFSKTVNTGK